MELKIKDATVYIMQHSPPKKHTGEKTFELSENSFIYWKSGRIHIHYTSDSLPNDKKILYEMEKNK